VGLLCAFVPLPFQMFIAAGVAIIAHANLPVSVVLVWLTNPITIPPMFYGAYKVGAWVMQTPEQDFHFEISFEWLSNGMSAIWQSFLLGCAILGVSCGILGYLGIKLMWRWMVVRKWRNRHQTDNS